MRQGRGLPQRHGAAEEAPPPGMVQQHEAPLLPPSTPRQERAFSSGPAIYVWTGSAAPIGCEDRRLPLAAHSSIAATGWLGSLHIHTVRLRQTEAELRRCWKRTGDGGRKSSLGNGEGGSGGGRAVAANGRALSVPCGCGGHDTELLGAGLHGPRQRAEPGARHLLPPVSAAAPRAPSSRPPSVPRLPFSICRRFPVDAAQRREWIRAVNRVDPQSRQTWRPGPGAILCSRHFAEADFERYGLRRKLRRGAVPSRFPHPVRVGNERAPLYPAKLGRGDLPSPFPGRSRCAPAGGARPSSEL